MRLSIIVSATVLLASGLPAQAVNDTCANALFVGIGMPTSGSNVGATTGPDPIGNCFQMGADVWYAFVPTCTGSHVVSTCGAGTTFDTVIAVWAGTNGCGALVPIGCNDDSCGLSSSVSFQVTAGAIYYVSVGGYYGATGSFVLNVNVGNGSGIVLAFNNLGPGTIGFTLNSGPSTGSFIAVMSLNQGAYPNGWFFGIDVQTFELQLMLNSGYPFQATLDWCGSFAFGPIGGAPSGVSVFAVAFGFPVGASVPSTISAPATMTIP